MRIVEINMMYPGGSTGRIVYDIARKLRSAGNECYIAYLFGEKQTEYEYRLKSKFGLYISIIQSRFLGRNGFTDKRATRRLVKWIQNIEPDVVHLHNLHGLYIDIRILFEYLRKSGVSVVWTLHDCWSITGHCASFDYIGCDKWQYGCHTCEQLNLYPMAWRDCSKKNYDDKKAAILQMEPKRFRITVPSIWLQDVISKSYLKEYCIQQIYNGIDTEMFSEVDNNLRERLGLQNKKVVLAVAFGYNIRKGLLDLNKIADMLDKEFQIILIGIDDKDRHHINSKIMVYPKTKSQKELAEFYSAADVYINLTLEEVLGMTNIEAMACGTPVITYNTGGSPECLDNTTGAVVERGNVNDVVRKIIDITSKDKKMYSAACRTRAVKLFDKSIMVKSYISIYEDMLECNKS